MAEYWGLRAIARRLGQRDPQGVILLPIVLLVGLLFSSVEASAVESILTCTFSSGTAGFYAEFGKPIKGRFDSAEPPWTVVFAGLDSDSPRFKGNLGEAPLVVLRRTSDTVWLAEVLPIRGLNVWTIFFDSQIVILSKQYKLLDQPFGLLSMGRCE